MSNKIEASCALTEIIAREMDRLGYGHHESHAASILHAIQAAAQHQGEPVAWILKNEKGRVEVILPYEPCASDMQPYWPEPIKLYERTPEQPALPRYTCIGKGGEYELLGESHGAGDDLRGTFQMIYRDVATGQLYNRNRESFAERMKLLD